MISASREIHSINLYRNGYENALNTFKRIKVEVSSNEDFSDANVLFGTADVEETAATKLAAQTINLTTPVTARYVRIWQKGHCIQNTNSSWKGYSNGVGLREIEVIAKLKDGETLPDAQETRNILEKGDIEEGLNAAAAVGDDRLQRASRGYVSPESFTHGTSAQRASWFRRGLDSGRIEACDTFARG